VASALVNTTQQIGGSLGTALLNTLAATATASYILAHGWRHPRPASSMASPSPLRSGAGFLALGAVLSAVFISAGPTEVSPAEGAVVGAGS